MGFKGKSISIASYDAGNRLTAWNRAGADENHSQTWNYDDAGNWNSTTKDGDTESRDHSVSNQITQLDGKAVSHDLKGNLTEYEYYRTDYRVKYDLDNRIVEVKADSETIRYRYDALGRRIVSKGDDETVLIWWGDSECAEYEHRASKDAIQNDIMGHPTRLNSVIARDTEDRENRVELQWYHKNYLDHVYAVSDDNGNLVEHYRYTAFGEPEIYSATGAKRNTSAIGNTVMWNTRRYDADNGLYYYKYRHYAANIGRWPSRDPIEEDGGINLYAFVGNEPTLYWDYLGLIDNKRSTEFEIGQEKLRSKIHSLIDDGGRLADKISRNELSKHNLANPNNKWRYGKEWGGKVCGKCVETKKDEPKKYKVYRTKAASSGKFDSVVVWDLPDCDDGYIVVGLYHNHGDIFGTRGTGLSPADLSISINGKPKRLGNVPKRTPIGATFLAQDGKIKTHLHDPRAPYDPNKPDGGKTKLIECPCVEKE